MVAGARPAVLAGPDPADQPGEPLERVVERRPVLEIHRAPDLLREAGDEPAAAAVAQALVRGLHVVERPRQEPRHGRPDDEVVVLAVRDLVLDPRELPLADHEPRLAAEDPARAGVDDDDPHAAEVPPVRPQRATGAVGLPVCGLGEGAQDRLAVGRGADLAIRLVGREPGGGQVAEVLVDPVRAQGAGDPLVPPARRLHLVAPRARRVPVVAGRRGRRRSSSSARPRAASGRPGRSTPPGTGACTPRSSRPA